MTTVIKRHSECDTSGLCASGVRLAHVASEFSSKVRCLPRNPSDTGARCVWSAGEARRRHGAFPALNRSSEGDQFYKPPYKSRTDAHASVASDDIPSQNSKSRLAIIAARRDKYTKHTHTHTSLTRAGREPSSPKMSSADRSRCYRLSLPPCGTLLIVLAVVYTNRSYCGDNAARFFGRARSWLLARGRF